jgi:hypothetical protein
MSLLTPSGHASDTESIGDRIEPEIKSVPADDDDGGDKAGTSTGPEKTDDEEDSMTMDKSGSSKRKATATDGMKKSTFDGKKTSACSAKSTPATQPAAKKAKTGTSKLDAIMVKEEETTQKVLELKKIKAKGEADKALAKIQAKSDLKLQQYKLKAQLAMKKMEMEEKRRDHEFQLRMAQLGQSRAGPSTESFGAMATTASPGWSDVGSATPSSLLGELHSDPFTFDFSGMNSHSDYDTK